MTAPLQSAPVTLVDVYTKQVELGAALAVIHEQLKQLPDHEQRLRTLEAAKAKLWGASIALGAVAGGVASWIALAVAHKP